MCGRFSIAVRIGTFAKRFGITEPFDCALPRYNIAPSEAVPVIVRKGAQNIAVMMRFGIPPFNTDRTGSVQDIINVRAESFAANRLFYNSSLQGRCLVPATGFYEWRTDGDRKTPYYLSKKDKSLFAMAGLYATRETVHGSITRSFSIITIAPNDLVAPLHNRMPVILSPGGEQAWMEYGEEISDSIKNFLVPYPAEEMEVFEVSLSVNNPANKTEASVARIRQETLDGF